VLIKKVGAGQIVRPRRIIVLDLLYVAIMVVFVVVTALFVVGCDKIIGPDDAALAEQGPDPDVAREKVAA